MNNVISSNKESFIQKFLVPLSRIADNIVVNFNGKKLSAVCASQDGSIIVSNSFKLASSLIGIYRINIPDVKKFIRLLDTINSQELELTVKENCLSYEDRQQKFNYFLLEDSFIQRCPVNVKKIESLKYDTGFILEYSKFSELLKSSSITTDTDKVYLYTKDGCVYGELNDYERQNINNITYRISDKFVGDDLKECIPLNLENVRLLSGIKCERFLVKINNKLKIILFEVEGVDQKTQFILSGLVK